MKAPGGFRRRPFAPPGPPRWPLARARIIFAAVGRFRIFRAALLAAAVACSGPAAAAVAEYALDVGEDAPVAFEIPFEMVHPGKVSVEATWSGGRILTFRIEGPGIGLVERRSGPSPQRVEVDADAAPRGIGLYWKLLIRALPARGAISGTVRIEVPDDPAIVQARDEAKKPPPPPPPVPDPWTLRRTPPDGAAIELVRVFAAIEPLRAMVFPSGNDSSPDVCGWQPELTREISGWRDRIAEGAAAPAESTLRFLGRLAHAVRAVDAMRTSSNPLIAGPVPEESRRRRAWATARRDELAPLERELDLLNEMLRGGHAPELESALWTPRFIACLTASERYFDERVSLGPDRAANRPVAEAQWPQYLAAAGALEAMAGLLADGTGAP